MKKVIISTLLFITAIAINAQGKKVGTIEIGETVSIKSTVLNTDQKIMVYLPERYAESSERYPVIYILWSKTYFLPAVGIMKYLATYNYIPEMIIIGIPNNNSIHDYTPTRTKMYPSGGGADNYLKFIKTELIPYVDESYRTLPFRIFSGHSLGGLCVLYSFIQEPEMFNAFIAISSSVYWDDGVLQKRAEKVFQKTDHLKKSLYFSVEGGEDHHTKTNKDFAKFLKNNPLKELQWKFDLMPGKTHTSLWIESFNNGLHFVSPYNLSQYVLMGGIQAILKHFNDLDMNVSENLLTKYALDFQEKENFPAAIEVVKYMIKNNPKSADLYHGLGDMYRDSDQYELAMETFKKGMTLAEKNSNQDMIDLFKQHIVELKQLMNK